VQYAPSLPPALSGISFKLQHGAKVGVTGRTGSGKSTLLVALFRIVQPSSGSIVVDQRDVLVPAMSVRLKRPAVPPHTRAQAADLEALRNQLGIIPQEPAMFSGTLRENVDPCAAYSDAEVAAALAECGLEGRSLLSAVGVSGENFSLGEKQLVCKPIAPRCVGG
jgi:ATP-binding cassette subfamily C (CFTR/MRP) protein 10